MLVFLKSILYSLIALVLYDGFGHQVSAQVNAFVPPPRINPLIENYATATRSSIWPENLIPVCWENPTADDTYYRDLVSYAVQNTWVRFSALRFIGWERCDTASRGIRILIADDGPHVKALGRYLDSRPEGMVLNFTFNNWSLSCRGTRDFCIYAIAVHEFGHAIGLAHEQNRDDAPAECHLESQGTTGDYEITDYDPFSVMNYCNPDWNGNGQLSGLDVEAVQALYGFPAGN